MIAFFQLSDGFFPYTGFALVVLLEAFVSMAKKLSDLGFVFRSVELFFKLFVQLDWVFGRIRAFREIHYPLFKLSKWHAFQLGLFLGLLNKKVFRFLNAHAGDCRHPASQQQPKIWNRTRGIINLAGEPGDRWFAMSTWVSEGRPFGAADLRVNGRKVRTPRFPVARSGTDAPRSTLWASGLRQRA